MADDAQAVAEAPEQVVEDAPDSSQESTKPTPVRESLERRGDVTRAAREKALDSVRESITKRQQEQEPEEPEEPDEADEAPEAREQETPEAEAEEGAGDGVPTPPDERVTEDVPEGTYREQSTGRLKDTETHRYVEEPKAEATIEDDEAAASDVDGEPSPPESDAPAVPEGFEQIDLPPNHPLRDRGETQMAIPSADLVGDQMHQYYRHLVNAGSQLREMQQQMQQMQQQSAQQRIRQQVMQSEDIKKLDPEHNEELRDRIEDYRKTYGDEAVENDILEPLRTRREKLAEERTREQLSERQQVGTATQFVGAAAQVANRMYDDLSGHVQMVPMQDPQTGEHRYVLSGQGRLHQLMAEGLQRYGAYVEQTGRSPDVRELFEDYIEPLYFKIPEVRQRIQQEREQREQSKEEQVEERVRQERKEEERKKLEEAAQRRATNPHAQTPNVATDKQTPRPESEPIETEGKTAKQIADQIKERFGIAR